MFNMTQLSLYESQPQLALNSQRVRCGSFFDPCQWQRIQQRLPLSQPGKSEVFCAYRPIMDVRADFVSGVAIERPFGSGSSAVSVAVRLVDRTSGLSGSSYAVARKRGFDTCTARFLTCTDTINAGVRLKQTRPCTVGPRESAARRPGVNCSTGPGNAVRALATPAPLFNSGGVV